MGNDFIVHIKCSMQVELIIMQEKAALLRKSNSFFSTLSESYCQFYLPKCLVIISQAPYFKLHVNLLKIHREMRKKNPTISCSINQQMYSLYLKLLQQRRQSEWDIVTLKHQGKSLQCPIEVAFDYYIQNCNLHQSGEALFMQKSSNRQVLHLYKLNPNSIFQLSYFFHLPLSAKTLRIAISAILQQKQLIFTSNNQNLNVMLIETIMQMVLPFKWSHMYVPNLPFDMLEAAQECFLPYIVGIQKKNLSLIDTDQRIVIDVDSDSVQINGTLNQLPQSYEKYLNTNSNNKNYLQWERQVRINSILMICELLSDGCYCQYDQLLRMSKQQRQGFSDRLPKTIQPFYEQLIKKTMIFSRFIEDRHEETFRQVSQLLSMHPENRKLMIFHRFNNIKNQALNPAKFDNQKCWIRFYQKYNVSKKKFRYAVTSKSISMTDMYKSNIIQKNNESTTTINTSHTIRNIQPTFNKSVVKL